jgi:Cdc6-like AAA superfamily ATPase
LLAKLNAALAFGKRLKADNEWNSYNAPYIAHIEAQIDGAKPQIQSLLNAQSPNGSTNMIGCLNSLFTALSSISSHLHPNLDELFEHFKYGNKNYVVFGKNGSGKTTLLRKISADVLNENSVVIPADRSVKINVGGHECRKPN